MQISDDVWQFFGYSLSTTEQGHHHNCDWAARWMHILCSVCVHSSATLAKDVRLFCSTVLFVASTESQKMSYQTWLIDIFTKQNAFQCVTLVLQHHQLKLCHSQSLWLKVISHHMNGILYVHCTDNHEDWSVAKKVTVNSKKKKNGILV